MAENKWVKLTQNTLRNGGKGKRSFPWGNKACFHGIFSLVSYTRIIHCVKKTPPVKHVEFMIHLGFIQCMACLASIPTILDGHLHF